MPVLVVLLRVPCRPDADDVSSILQRVVDGLLHLRHHLAMLEHVS